MPVCMMNDMQAGIRFYMGILNFKTFLWCFSGKICIFAS